MGYLSTNVTCVVNAGETERVKMQGWAIPTMLGQMFQQLNLVPQMTVTLRSPPLPTTKPLTDADRVQIMRSALNQILALSTKALNDAK